MMEEIIVRGQVAGYKFEPWLKTSKEDMFIINIDDVLTMSESDDVDMIVYYQDYIRKANQGNYSKPSRKMGYLGNVNETKEVLEKLFNNS